MLPFKTLLVIEEKGSLAIFRQLASQLVKLIQQGTLQPGTWLPSTRTLAEILGLHRKTVISAYEELLAQDWIQSIPRKGFMVSSNLPVIKPKSYLNGGTLHAYTNSAKFTFDTDIEGTNFNTPNTPPSTIIVNDGFPDISLTPFEMILKNYRHLIAQNTFKRLLGEKDFGGTPAIKHSMCSFLNETRGLNITSDNITITRGAQMAIYIAASLLIKPGDKVIVSDPSYGMANAVFKRLGAELISVPVDKEGLDTDIIEEILKKTKVRLLYIIPHHHHPTTVTMSSSRRLRLLELIKEHRLPVIEDDYDYDFHYHNSPFLPLASADHDGYVMYIGSFTKILASSFRLGYIVAAPNFIRETVKLKRLMDLRGDSLMEEAISMMINEGELSRHIKRSNKLYNIRCNDISMLIEEELNHAIDFTKPQGGMALWLKFKAQYPLADILPKAINAGLHINGSAYYHGEDIKHNALRFGFVALNKKDMVTAVEILKKITTT